MGQSEDQGLNAAADKLVGEVLCDGSASGDIAAFQTAWNQTQDVNLSSIGLTLVADGKYGPNTAKALAYVQNGSPDGTGIPQPCVFCSDGAPHDPGYACPQPQGGGGCTDPGSCPQGTAWDTTSCTCVALPGAGPSYGMSKGMKIFLWLLALAAVGTIGYVVVKHGSKRKLSGRAGEPKRLMARKYKSKKGRDTRSKKERERDREFLKKHMVPARKKRKR